MPQQVVHYGHMSDDSFVVRSGVLQESVLVPLFSYYVYVNDLPGHVSPEISM